MTDIEFGRVHKTKPHLFADAVELWVSLAGYRCASKTDALSLMQQSIKDAEDLLPLEESDLDGDDYPDDLGGAEITELEQSYVDECFQQIEYRCGEFGESYPFSLVAGSLELNANLDTQQYLYLFLLAASRSRSFKRNRGIAQRLADAFELVCKDALAHLMSPRAEVVMFGPNARDRAERFDTNLRQALPKLADFMGMRMAPDWSPDDERPQGDGQIDLVGAQRLDSVQGGWNVYLAQCAASEEESYWQKKRAEADITYHTSRFHYTVESQSVLFIPVCYREHNGNWYNKSFADGVILMDRVRLLRNVDGEEPSTEVVIGLLADEFDFTGAMAL